MKRNEKMSRTPPKSIQSTKSITSTTSTTSTTNSDDDELIALLMSKFDHKINHYENGLNAIEGTIIEQFYHAFLAVPSNLKNKKHLTRAIYRYIRNNNIKVIGGKFALSFRLLYYLTF
jgi:hypothetical protein